MWDTGFILNTVSFSYIMEFHFITYGRKSNYNLVLKSKAKRVCGALESTYF